MTQANFADFEDIRPASSGGLSTHHAPTWAASAAHTTTHSIFRFVYDLTSSTTSSTPHQDSPTIYSQTVNTNVSFYTGPGTPTVHVDGRQTGTTPSEAKMGIGGVKVAVFNFRYIDLKPPSLLLSPTVTAPLSFYRARASGFAASSKVAPAPWWMEGVGPGIWRKR